MTSVLFAPPRQPSTSLGRYRLLSPKANIKVSPLCLGGMSLGTNWKDEPAINAELDKAGSFELLDAFYKAGGNFIDTANNYQDGQSEEIIGEWMETHKIRNEIVLATKFTSPVFEPAKMGPHTIGANFAGNGAKSLHTSVESSLKRLRTDYIDILYVHWWDHTADIPLFMQSLNRLVTSGKVLYLAVSDTPAWVVSKANQYARDHGMAEFVLYQGKWNLGYRDMEREVIPMCRSEGMGIAPWAVLGQGRFRTAEEVAAREKEHGRAIRQGKQSETEKQVGDALSRISKKHAGASGSQLCVAWIMAKYPYCYPIVGGTKIRYIDDNIKGLDIKLNEEEIKELETIIPFDFGFPTAMIGHDVHETGTTWSLHNHVGVVDYVRHKNTADAVYQGPFS